MRRSGIQVGSALALLALVLPTRAQEPAIQVTVTPTAPRVGQPFRVEVVREAPRNRPLPELDWPPEGALGGALRVTDLPGSVAVLAGRHNAVDVFLAHAFRAGTLPLPDGRELTIASSLGEPPDLALEWPPEPLPIPRRRPSPAWLLLLPGIGLGWWGLRRSRRKAEAAAADPGQGTTTGPIPPADPAPDALRRAGRERLAALRDLPLADRGAWTEAHEQLAAVFREEAVRAGLTLESVTPADLDATCPHRVAGRADPQSAQILAGLGAAGQRRLAELLRRCDVARFGPTPPASGERHHRWHQTVSDACDRLEAIWGVDR